MLVSFGTELLIAALNRADLLADRSNGSTM